VKSSKISFKSALASAFHSLEVLQAANFHKFIQKTVFASKQKQFQTQSSYIFFAANRFCFVNIEKKIDKTTASTDGDNYERDENSGCRNPESVKQIQKREETFLVRRRL
jgi:hypothetical protein